MKYQYKLFLSYSHKDAEIASFIYEKLTDAGFSCFMAEKEILPSQQWSPTIKKALVNSEKLFILLTPRSKNSMWVAAEAGAAWGLGKEIIPAVMFVDSSELIDIINQWQSHSVETPTQVDLLISKLNKTQSKPINNLSNDTIKEESFIDKNNWDNLIKIGNWSISENEDPVRIAGKGRYCYLLSSKEYGQNPYTIEAKLSFQPNENGSILNAGIVLGFNYSNNAPAYHHLMFTGNKIIIESIGANGGAEDDFQHITPGHDFDIIHNKKYRLKIDIDHNVVKIHLDEKLTLSALIPNLGSGLVGLRPWRSKITCWDFHVREVQ